MTIGEGRGCIFRSVLFDRNKVKLQMQATCASGHIKNKKRNSEITFDCLVCAVLCLVASVVSDSLQPHGLPGSSVHKDSLGKNTGVGFHALLQGIFLVQGLNPCLLHCRQILYH